MKLQDLLDQANAVSDESLTFAEAYTFFNDCIARINIELDSNFPFYTATDTAAVPPIPDKWQIALFVPFVSARIKQVDASQFEYSQHFSEFFNNLAEFKMKYIVPDEYKETTENSANFAPDFTGNWNIGSW